jgi:photosystem II stability/assembly factor-like uncharacterized protein
MALRNSGRDKPARPRPTLLLGTAKGAFRLGKHGAHWKLSAPALFGSKVNDFVLDPRDGRTLLAASNGGHLGPTIYRSTDRGRTWTETTAAPRFGPASKAKKFVGTSRGKAVKLAFWLEPGAASQPGVWYATTSPQGLFRSDDGGVTWRGVDGLNENPRWSEWFGDGEGGTPEGPPLHSVIVDPRDPRRLYVGASSGGVFESHDEGATWRPLNRGVAADFLPPGEHEFGHDPHRVMLAPSDPDRLWQQNHCGFYRLDRTRGEVWKRVGKALPKEIGDIGFGVAAHPTDRDRVWMIPMDGTKLWPRTTVGGRPCLFHTADGGRTWTRQDRGLPRADAYWTVLRQALTADDEPEAVGIYFGTTSGEVWASFDAGAHWECLARHLPRIYSLRLARFGKPLR